jgi:hypothetical protein
VLWSHHGGFKFRAVVAAARAFVDGCQNEAINGGGRTTQADAEPTYFWLCAIRMISISAPVVLWRAAVLTGAIASKPDWRRTLAETAFARIHTSW